MNRLPAMWCCLLGAASACAPSPNPAGKGSGTASEARELRGGSEVRVWGALKAVMHEGKTEGTVALENVAPGPHAYAVGALSELRGEVTILDDDVIVSFGEPGGIVRTPPQAPRGEMATLLVQAAVPTWSDHAVESAITLRTAGELIEKIANGAGLDVEKRIPVVIEATAKNIDWHVLSGQGASGHDSHPAATGHGAHHGRRSVGKLSGAKVTLVGFFSRHDEAVFTHMGEHTHFHVVPSGARMTGHVDDMELEPGAVVRVPARK